MPPKVKFPYVNKRTGQGTVSLSAFKKGNQANPLLRPRPEIQERYRQAVAELMALSKLTPTQMKDRVMDPALGYNKPNVFGYHHTPVENTNSILKRGLELRSDQNPTSFSDHDWLSGRVDSDYMSGKGRTYLEMLEGIPPATPSGSLPTSITGKKLSLFQVPIEEAIKRLDPRELFKLLGAHIAHQRKYPFDTGISRIIVRNKTGFDPGRGVRPARELRLGYPREGVVDIPEWKLTEAIPAQHVKQVPYSADEKRIAQLEVTIKRFGADSEFGKKLREKLTQLIKIRNNLK